MQLDYEHRPLVLDWDGRQRRDFISVHDIVQANLLAIEKASAGQTYNVATGNSCTLLELVDMIEKTAGYPLQRIRGPKRPGDLHQSCADISKLRNLGFVPKVTLQQGLTEMWQHQLRQKTK
ncbi:MAG: GDP-mannose 4,6-dehydratase [Elusimicrobiaceae bacterium]|nr:GDP-mannose 4,6-dehydratase [Elusimicrobiaceae bacterium]